MILLKYTSYTFWLRLLYCDHMENCCIKKISQVFPYSSELNYKCCLIGERELIQKWSHWKMLLSLLQTNCRCEPRCCSRIRGVELLTLIKSLFSIVKYWSLAFNSRIYAGITFNGYPFNSWLLQRSFCFSTPIIRSNCINDRSRSSSAYRTIISRSCVIFCRVIAAIWSRISIFLI